MLNPTVFKNVLNDTSKYIAINMNDDYTLMYYLIWQNTLKHNQNICIICNTNVEQYYFENIFKEVCKELKCQDINIKSLNTIKRLTLKNNTIDLCLSGQNLNLNNNYNIIILSKILNNMSNIFKNEFLLNVMKIIEKNNGQLFLRTDFNNNDTIDWAYIVKTITEKNINCLKNSRQGYNKLILNVLQKQIELCPDLRFWQILYNLGILKSVDNKNIIMAGLYVYDNYYLESKDTYYQMIKQFKNMQMQCEKIYPNTLYVNENDEFIYCSEINDNDFLAYELTLLKSHKIYIAKEINTNDTYLINEYGMAIKPDITVSEFTNYIYDKLKEVKLGKLNKE